MLTLPVSALGSQSSEDAIAHHCTPWPRGEPQLPSIPRLCVTPSEEPVRMPCASPSPFAVRSRVAAPAGGPGAAGRRRFWFGQKGTGVVLFVRVWDQHTCPFDLDPMRWLIERWRTQRASLPWRYTCRWICSETGTVIQFACHRYFVKFA